MAWTIVINAYPVEAELKSVTLDASKKHLLICAVILFLAGTVSCSHKDRVNVEVICDLGVADIGCKCSKEDLLTTHKQWFDGNPRHGSIFRIHIFGNNIELESDTFKFPKGKEGNLPKQRNDAYEVQKENIGELYEKALTKQSSDYQSGKKKHHAKYVKQDIAKMINLVLNSISPAEPWRLVLISNLRQKDSEFDFAISNLEEEKFVNRFLEKYAIDGPNKNSNIVLSACGYCEQEYRPKPSGTVDSPSPSHVIILCDRSGSSTNICDIPELQQIFVGWIDSTELEIGSSFEILQLSDDMSQYEPNTLLTIVQNFPSEKKTKADRDQFKIKGMQQIANIQFKKANSFSPLVEGILAVNRSFENYGDGHRLLIIISDMRQDTPVRAGKAGLKFEDNIPDYSYMQKWLGEWAVSPSKRNIDDLFICGFHGSGPFDPSKIRKTEELWKKTFPLIGYNGRNCDAENASVSKLQLIHDCNINKIPWAPYHPVAIPAKRWKNMKMIWKAVFKEWGFGKVEPVQRCENINL